MRDWDTRSCNSYCNETKCCLVVVQDGQSIRICSVDSTSRESWSDENYQWTGSWASLHKDIVSSRKEVVSWPQQPHKTFHKQQSISCGELSDTYILDESKQVKEGLKFPSLILFVILALTRLLNSEWKLGTPTWGRFHTCTNHDEGQDEGVRTCQAWQFRGIPWSLQIIVNRVICF